VRTLLERNQSLVSDNHDRQLEDTQKKLCDPVDIQIGLSRKSEISDDEGHKEEIEKQLRKLAPYRVSLCGRHIGKVARVMKRHWVPVTMKPFKTLRRLLVHPKDQRKRKKSWTVFTKFLVAVVRRLT